jgi:NAD(P)-dependent dehydrogenase (short-subunit alcohol dehydrogenase family)
VVPQVCDVRDDAAVQGLARWIADRHGGVDFVDSNATAAISPGVPYAGQVGDLINTNNLGATRMIRSFGRLDGGEDQQVQLADEVTQVAAGNPQRCR